VSPRDRGTEGVDFDHKVFFEREADRRVETQLGFRRGLRRLLGMRESRQG